MPTPSKRLADALGTGDPDAVRRIAGAVLPTSADNLVPRPWGGTHLVAFKGLDEGPGARETRFGESFELAADPTDPEARAHPSRVTLPDGSLVDLPSLLAVAGARILGPSFVARHGARIPLLPKFLDIHELLSVQAHPPGHPETYVVLDAEEGATIGLGFRRDVDPAALGVRMTEARRAQERLVEDGFVEAAALPRGLVDDLSAAVLPHLRTGADARAAARLLDVIARASAEMLDLLHAVPVHAGDVIDNSTPSTRGDAPSAEIHALGNPERREVLLLEVRKPGPSLRAWDHARFPPRPLDIEAALAAVNTRATSPDDFRATRRPIPGQPGVAVSVSGPYYELLHLTPAAAGETGLVLPAGDRVRTLHVVRGRATIDGGTLEASCTLARGASALLPAEAGSFRISGDGNPELVLVNIP